MLKIFLSETTKPSKLCLKITDGFQGLDYHPYSERRFNTWYKPRHLYILSDDKPNKGEFYIDRDGVLKQVKSTKGGLIYHNLDDEYNLYFDRNDEIMGKVIKTTNSELSIEQVNEDFINKWIKEYNKGNFIEEINSFDI